MIVTARTLASLTWLEQNYSHIWYNEELTLSMKAGFLAACCDSRRCCLGMLSLMERIDVIYSVLPRKGV